METCVPGAMASASIFLKHENGKGGRNYEFWDSCAVSLNSNTSPFSGVNSEARRIPPCLYTFGDVVWRECVLLPKVMHGETP